MPLGAQSKLQYHLPIMLAIHIENHMGKQYVQYKTVYRPTSFSRDLPHPGLEPVSPVLAGRFFTQEAPSFLSLMQMKAHGTWLFSEELLQQSLPGQPPA